MAGQSSAARNEPESRQQWQLEQQRDRARWLLDRAREGQDISPRKVDWALIVLGDIRE